MHNHLVWPVLLVLLCWHASTGALAAGRSDAALALPCNGCHGPDGVSQAGSIPSIAGLDREYHYEVLLGFKEGRRNSTIMQRIAKGYTGSELRKIARYFSLRSWGTSNPDGDVEQVTRGLELHELLCKDCHEDMGRYQDKDVPRLAGQRPEYLLLQMTLYLEGVERLPQPTEMAEQLAKTGSGDLEALSAFYASVQ